jgi:hypothetical protein
VKADVGVSRELKGNGMFKNLKLWYMKKYKSAKLIEIAGVFGYEKSYTLDGKTAPYAGRIANLYVDGQGNVDKRNGMICSWAYI